MKKNEWAVKKHGNYHQVSPFPPSCHDRSSIITIGRLSPVLGASRIRGYTPANSNYEVALPDENELDEHAG
ncbi:MAG: hypothetical protein ACR2RF_12505 [Geminicoccaceae bacterium]